MSMDETYITSKIDKIKPHLPTGAVIFTTISGLALVAPLEHSAGLALGLGWGHAWTLTALIEGASGASYLSGVYVEYALALTGTSILIGTLQSRYSFTKVVPWRDYVGLGLSTCIVALTVAAFALTNRVKYKIQAHRKLQIDRKTEQENKQRAEQYEREDIQRASELQESERQRTHTLELARMHNFAEQERERLRIEHERARAVTEQRQAEAERERAAASASQAEAEHARADRERQRALAEQAQAQAEREQSAREQRQARAEQRRADREREQAEAERQASADRARASAEQADREREQALYAERLRNDRDFAKIQWTLHDWSAKELANLLNVSETRARAILAEWRSLHLVENE